MIYLREKYRKGQWKIILIYNFSTNSGHKNKFN